MDKQVEPFKVHSLAEIDMEELEKFRNKLDNRIAEFDKVIDGHILACGYFVLTAWELGLDGMLTYKILSKMLDVIDEKSAYEAYVARETFM